MDLITQLPDSHGYTAILNIVDCFTKRAHFIATSHDVTSEGVTHLLQDNIWKHHGFPKKVITDHGSQFASKFALSLGKLLGIKLALSTAYHP